MIPNPYPGRFIVMEGLDGSGLSTQSGLLLKRIVEKVQVRAELTKEPTDGPAGAQIRMALRHRLKVDEHTLALLFAADRMDHLCELIKPRLKDGVHVICDRYYLSSFAYQSVGVQDLDWLIQLNSKFIVPDLTIVLQVPSTLCLSNILEGRFGVERYEKEAELEKVWEGYLKVIPLLKSRGERIEIIDASNVSIEDVRRRVWDICKDLFKNGKNRNRPDQEIEQPRLLG